MTDLRRLAARGLGVLPGPVREFALAPVRRLGDPELLELTPMPEAGHRLYVGPWNTAGQGWAWARAAEQHLPDVAAQNLFAQRSGRQVHFSYCADHTLSSRAQWGHVRQIHGARVLSQATHVLFESGRPVLGNFHAGSMLDDVGPLREASICSAVVYHGSEIRNLSQHAERFPHSPFRGEHDEYLAELQSIVDKNLADLEEFDGAVLVSTPDLLEMVPRSRWLPIVVDVDRLATDSPVLERARPVVLHAPSNPRLKGGPTVRQQLEVLHARGIVEYRPMVGLCHAEMVAAIQDADIVLDQFALGATGVFAAEAQAAGRVVVAHLADHLRAVLGDVDGEAPPIVEAAPETVGTMVEMIVHDRDRYRALAAAAAAWARRNHDGRRAAQVLNETLLSR